VISSIEYIGGVAIRKKKLKKRRRKQIIIQLFCVPLSLSKRSRLLRITVAKIKKTERYYLIPF
jgi:hypothetical protein